MVVEQTLSHLFFCNLLFLFVEGFKEMVSEQGVIHLSYYLPLDKIGKTAEDIVDEFQKAVGTDFVVKVACKLLVALILANLYF
jgi:hypothetical protein